MSKKINLNTEYKPSPTAKLTEKVGARILGTLRMRLKNAQFPKKFDYLIQVEDTDVRTVLWDKENKKEIDVDIAVGDSVFVRGFTQLDKGMAQIADGARVEIVYLGLGKKKPGQKPPFLVDITDHSVEA